MARRLKFSHAEVSSSSWYAVDQYSPLTSIAVEAVGTVNYTIQHTLDDTVNSSATPLAFDHDTLAAQTTTQDGNYAFPISAIRVTINSGAGSVNVTVLQAGGAVL